jgi:hypothetical protein
MSFYVLKSNAALLALAIVAIAAATAVGVVGCVSKSQSAGSNSSFAAAGNGQTTGQSSQPNGSHRNFNHQQMLDNIKNALVGLAANGTITQVQSGKVLQAYTQAFANHSQGSGQQGSGQHSSGKQYSGPILAQLVSNGTITQNQATDINQAIAQARANSSPKPGASGSGQTTTQ